MRVLVIAQYFPPDMGGGATRAYNAVKGLSKLDCEVTVVAAVPHYPNGNVPSRYRWKPLHIEMNGTLRVIRTFVPPLASRGMIRRILLFLSFIVSSLFALPYVRKVDIVWAANPNIAAMIPGAVYGRLKHCPVVQNVDDLWPEALFDLGIGQQSIFGRIGAFMARLAYRLANGATPISPAYVQTINKKYGMKSSAIHVVKAGVDTKRFKPVSWQDSKDSFNVLYIGAFSPAYDFEQVFRAAEHIGSSDVHILIRGGGELADELKRRMHRSDSSSIEVLDEIVDRKDVAALLTRADALLLPLKGIGSIELGISSKLYEYQAAGKPIICCSRGQPARYIVESASGLVVEPGNYQKLADSILFLKNNPAKAREMGSNGRNYVETHLSVEKIGMQLVEAFKEVIASG